VVLNTTTKLFFMNIKSSNHFCTHHLSVGFLVQLPTITCALSASCAPRTRVLGLESTDRALHSHSHFAFPQIGKKHHRSRLRRRTHCAARAAALRVVDRTDGITTRPLSDLSWYPPRASSQRRGLPSSCVAHKFLFLRRGQFLCRSRELSSSTPTSSQTMELPLHRSIIIDLLGNEGNHFHTFCGWPPFSTAVVTASRCLASRARLAPRKTFFRTCPRANAAGSAARALSSAHLVEPRHAHRF
jgi:hypothetical protein